VRYGLKALSLVSKSVCGWVSIVTAKQLKKRKGFPCRFQSPCFKILILAKKKRPSEDSLFNEYFNNGNYFPESFSFKAANSSMSPKVVFSIACCWLELEEFSSFLAAAFFTFFSLEASRFSALATSSKIRL
jgi:hypothetical protein